jgi:hypothetical protein
MSVGLPRTKRKTKTEAKLKKKEENNNIYGAEENAQSAISRTTTCRGDEVDGRKILVKFVQIACLVE